MTIQATPLLLTASFLDSIQADAAARFDSQQTVGIMPSTQTLFGIDNTDMLNDFFRLDGTADNVAAQAPAPDDAGGTGTLPDEPCGVVSPESEARQITGILPDEPCGVVLPESEARQITGILPDEPCGAEPPEAGAPQMAGEESAPASEGTANNDSTPLVTAASTSGGEMTLEAPGSVPEPRGLERVGSIDDGLPIPGAHQALNEAGAVPGGGATASPAPYLHTDDAALRQQYGEAVDSVHLGEGDFVTSYETTNPNGMVIRTNVTTWHNGTVQVNTPVVVRPPHAPGDGGGASFSFGGGGLSFGAKLAAGAGISVAVGGVGLGIWALADRDSIDDAFSSRSQVSGPALQDNPAPLNSPSLPGTGEAVTATTGENGTAGASDLASVTNDNPAVLQQWLLSGTSDSTASLEGPHFIDVGDSAGMDPRAQLFLLLTQGREFNNASSTEWVALLQSAMEQRVEWPPSIEHDLALIGVGASEGTL